MGKGTSDLAQNLMVSAITMKRSLVITGSSFIPQYLLVSLQSPDLRIRIMVHCNGLYMQFLTEDIKQECRNMYVSISIVYINTGTLLDEIKLTCAFYSKEPVQISPQAEPQCRARLFQYTLPPQHQQEIHNPVLVLQWEWCFWHQRMLILTTVHLYINIIVNQSTAYVIIITTTLTCAGNRWQALQMHKLMNSLQI